MTKVKPVQGHKRSHMSFGVSVSCQCGWTSVTFYGKGARSEANGEWQSHANKFRCDA